MKLFRPSIDPTVFEMYELTLTTGIVSEPEEEQVETELRSALMLASSAADVLGFVSRLGLYDSWVNIDPYKEGDKEPARKCSLDNPGCNRDTFLVEFLELFATPRIKHQFRIKSSQRGERIAEEESTHGTPNVESQFVNSFVSLSSSLLARSGIRGW